MSEGAERCANCGKVTRGDAVVTRGTEVFCDPICRYRFDRNGPSAAPPARAAAAPVAAHPASAAQPAVTAVTAAGSEYIRAGDQLQLMAKLGWILAAFSALLCLFGIAIVIQKMPEASSESEGWLIVVAFVLQLVLAGFVAFGMWSASRFERYPLALWSAALAMLPLTGPCIGLTMPLGVACFVALLEPQTAALFPVRGVSALPARLPKVALALALLGVLLFPAALAGMALGLRMLARNDVRLAPAPRRLAIAAVGVGAGAFTLSIVLTPVVLMIWSA